MEIYTLEDMCNYYYLPYYTIKDYKDKHPELEDQHVINKFLTTRLINRTKLFSTLDSINDSVPIENLELPVRECNILKRYGISTIGKLEVVPIRVLQNLNGIGKNYTKNIIAACEKFGINLRQY